MICLAVRIVTKPGEEAGIAETFRKLTEASRKEPGCLLYVAHQAKDDPRRFLVYEQYRDEAALEAHRNSGHFQEYVAKDIYERIEGREAELYLPLS